MRIQVSRKQIADNHYCMGVGYCDLQHLLRFASSPYYTAGTYGWNMDAYTFEFMGSNVCITTGYRATIDNCNHAGTYEIYSAYDKQAEEILSDKNYDSQKERIGKLIQEFLSVVFKPVLEGTK